MFTILFYVLLYLGENIFYSITLIVSKMAFFNVNLQKVYLSAVYFTEVYLSKVYLTKVFFTHFPISFLSRAGQSEAEVGEAIGPSQPYLLQIHLSEISDI